MTAMNTSKSLNLIHQLMHSYIQ